MTRLERMDKAIQDAIEVPEDIKRLAGQAASDLYFGPSDSEAEDYPGFQRACRAVAEWCAELGALYFSWDLEDVTSEPNDDVADYLKLRSLDIKRALFGRDLAEYL